MTRPTAFPSSPYPHHSFMTFPASGNLYSETGEANWIVVLQRDGTIRGPRPAITYMPLQRGVPTDVVAYHHFDGARGRVIASGQRTDVLHEPTRGAKRKAALFVMGMAVLTMLAIRSREGPRAEA